MLCLCVEEPVYMMCVEVERERVVVLERTSVYYRMSREQSARHAQPSKWW